MLGRANRRAHEGSGDGRLVAGPARHPRRQGRDGEAGPVLVASGPAGGRGARDTGGRARRLVRRGSSTSSSTSTTFQPAQWPDLVVAELRRPSASGSP